MDNYYLRGPIYSEPFVMVARVGRIPYYAHLTAQAGKEYVTFLRSITRSSLLIFIAIPRPGGIFLSATIGNNNYKMGALNFGSYLALAPTEEFSLFLPVTKEVANFGIFLTGVSYTLLLDNITVSILLEEDNILQTVTNFYVLPTTAYYSGNTISFNQILDLESSWSRGENIAVSIYTNKEDSYLNEPYVYCKNSGCEKSCKGGCPKNNELCLYDPEISGFACIVPPPPEIPLYRNPTFIAAAISLIFIFVLSIILLFAVILVR